MPVLNLPSTLDDEGDKIVRNAGNHVPSDTAHSRKSYKVFLVCYYF